MLKLKMVPMNLLCQVDLPCNVSCLYHLCRFKNNLVLFETANCQSTYVPGKKVTQKGLTLCVTYLLTYFTVANPSNELH